MTVLRKTVNRAYYGDVDEEGAAEVSEESLGGGDEERAEPVASRTRARSDSDNDPPRAVKRMNLGRPGRGGDIGQKPTVEQTDHVGGGTGTTTTMNQLDPRAIYARMVAAATTAAREADAAHGQEAADRESEDSKEEGSGPGSDENDTGGSNNQEGAEEDSEDVDDADEHDQEGGGDDDASWSGTESSQEAEGSLYTPSESESTRSGSTSDA